MTIQTLREIVTELGQPSRLIRSGATDMSIFRVTNTYRTSAPGCHGWNSSVMPFDELGPAREHFAAVQLTRNTIRISLEEMVETPRGGKKWVRLDQRKPVKTTTPRDWWNPLTPSTP